MLTAVGVGERPVGASEAEVEDLHAAVEADEDVLGLDVAVHDALGVGGGERLGDGGADRAGAPPGEGAVAQVGAQRLALEQLGNRVGDAGVAAEVEDGDDVGVREGGYCLGLAVEAGERGGVVGGRLRQAP